MSDLFKKPLMLLAAVVILFSLAGCEGKPAVKPDGPSITPIGGAPGEKVLFERDLKKLTDQRYYVAVDKNESDIFIQEDIFGKDLSEVEDMTRIKSEALGMPMYIEDYRTFGKPAYVLEIHPSDRRATQDFYITETSLINPEYFTKKHYLDNNINRAEALDKKRTVTEMTEFIRRFPNSIWVPRAISYIEYHLCAVQRKPKEAIDLYTKLKKEYPENHKLISTLDDYIKRAEDYREQYRKEAENQ